MKNNFRKFISAFLAVLMIAGVFSAVFSFASADDGGYSVGDIIEYGAYPQSEVTDEETLATLNALLTSDGWNSYNYYSGTQNVADGRMAASDYMKYEDVYYRGTTYRAVTFSVYRPYITGYKCNADNSYQDENGYLREQVYWFRFEPLQWRILDPDTGFVLCESLIDSQPYASFVCRNNNVYYTSTELTSYSNNYAESSVRTWLNDTFCSTAFTADQMKNIATTNVDNAAYSTEYSVYDSEMTNDKIFLLSWDEAGNSAYGFDADASRQAAGTDYAKAQGLYVSSSENYEGLSYWRLRSAGRYSDAACEVSLTGNTVSYYYYTYYAHYGIRPAMHLYNLVTDTVCTHDSISDWKTISEPTCTAVGAKIRTCNECGTVIDSEDIPVLGHIWQDEGIEWAEDGSTCTFNYICERDPSHIINFASESVSSTIEPTCTSDGSVTYTANYDANGIKRTETKTVILNATGHNDADKNGYCDECGEKVGPDLNDIVLTVPAGKSVNYRYHVSMTASVQNLPDGYHVAIYCGSVKLAESKDGESTVTYTTGEMKNDTLYTVKVIDAEGNAVSNDSGEISRNITVAVKHGFFKSISAFFKALFKKLPTVTL